MPYDFDRKEPAANPAREARCSAASRAVRTAATAGGATAAGAGAADVPGVDSVGAAEADAVGAGAGASTVDTVVPANSSAAAGAITVVALTPTNNVLVRANAEPRLTARRAFAGTRRAVVLPVETPLWSVVMGTTVPRISRLHQRFRHKRVPETP